jgi:hypothetical protein
MAVLKRVNLRELWFWYSLVFEPWHNCFVTSKAVVFMGVFYFGVCFPSLAYIYIKAAMCPSVHYRRELAEQAAAAQRKDARAALEAVRAARAELPLVFQQAAAAKAKEEGRLQSVEARKQVCCFVTLPDVVAGRITLGAL